VRCIVTLDDGDLLVATDQRLARLDPVTLAERARWNRSVRHATTMAVREGVVVAGNPVLPTITLVDLTSGGVRRKRHGPVVAILGRRDGDPVLVGASSGGLVAIEPDTAKARTLAPAPPAMAAALAEDGQGVWLVAGIGVHVTEREGRASVRPGEAVTRVEWHKLGDGTPRTVDVPLPVRTIAVSPGSLWLTPGPVSGSAQYVVIGSASGPWRVWRAPDRELVEAVAPALGLVVTTARRPGIEQTAITCHRLAV